MTTYRITTQSGRVVEGRVQGAGGFLGGGGPICDETAAEGALRHLRLFAIGGCRFGGYEPSPGHVRVYPHVTAESNGEYVDVDIRGARVEIVTP